MSFFLVTRTFNIYSLSDFQIYKRLPWWLSSTESPANARDLGSIPGSGRSLGEGNGNPLQYSCWGNPMDRRAWQATVHRVAKNQTQLKWLSMHTGDSMVKNPPANLGDTRDTGLIPGMGRFSGGGNGNPLQYSCCDHPMDSVAWWAIAHRITKRQTRPSD